MPALATALLLLTLAAAAPPAPHACGVLSCPARDTLLEHVIGPSSEGPLTGVAVVTAAAQRETNYALGGVIRNDREGGAGKTTNAVALLGAAVVNADCATAWGSNLVLSDCPDNRALQTGAGRAIVGAKYDLAAYSPHSTVQGIALLGSSAVQPAAAVALTVGELFVQQPGTARWTVGLVIKDGTVGPGRPALLIGARTIRERGRGSVRRAGLAQCGRCSTGDCAYHHRDWSLPRHHDSGAKPSGARRGRTGDGPRCPVGPSGAALAHAVRVRDLIAAPDDRTAKAAGVATDQVYRNGSALMSAQPADGCRRLACNRLQRCSRG